MQDKDDPISLTAFVVLSFLDNKYNLDANLRNTMNRGINYIAGEWKNIDAEQDPYSLAIVTYALHASLHPQKDQVGLKWEKSLLYLSCTY